MTDDTIIVSCGECGAEATGVNAMLSHIFDFHANYSAEEAVKYANIWADSAYERATEEEAEFAETQKAERGLVEWERARDEGRA